MKNSESASTIFPLDPISRAIAGLLGLIAACLVTSCDCNSSFYVDPSCPEQTQAEAIALPATLDDDLSNTEEDDVPSRIVPLIVPSTASTGILAYTIREPHIEFLITSDRRLQITFLDETDNLSTLPDQPITVRIVDHSPPSELAFVMNGRVLTSDLPLPEGDDQRLVVNYTGLSDAIDVLPPLNEWQPVGNDSAIPTLR